VITATLPFSNPSPKAFPGHVWFAAEGYCACPPNTMPPIIAPPESNNSRRVKFPSGSGALSSPSPHVIVCIHGLLIASPA
jgi:hypothetical protein